MPITGKEAQASFKRKQREAGLIQITEWIPAAAKEKAKAYLKSLRDNAAPL